jgi:D-sedoheptulose 7-phosphate isomerase
MSFSKRFQELSEAVSCCSFTDFQNLTLSEEEAFQTVRKMIEQTRLQKGIVYVIGNGGSAGLASHFSNDLMKALGIASQTLYDSNLLTCLSNDLGYENVFSYPLQKLLKPNDLLIAISSSGKSQNILNAAKVAQSCNAPMVTFSGFHSDNPLRRTGQLNFWIARSDYGLVEAAHFFLLHSIIDLWNNPFIEVSDAHNIGPYKQSQNFS